MVQARDIPEDPKVAEALAELQNYLSDAISPLVAAESLEILMTCPPEQVAAEIHAWTAAQYRRQGASVPVSDYLFHAVRKIHLVGEFKLLAPEPLELFLSGLKEAVLVHCPEADRELLRANLAHIEETRTGLTPTVAILHRQIGSEQPLATAAMVPLQEIAEIGTVVAQHMPPTEEQARAQRRLGVLLQRLERQLQATPAASAPEHQAELVAGLLAQAATTSASVEELGQFREDLRMRGLEAKLDEVFRLLSHNVPAWSAQSPSAGEQAPGSAQAGATAAMRRLLALDQDPFEGAKRVIAMVETAIEQFNAGGLGRAATMLDTARQALVERRTDTAAVQAFLAKAHEKLEPQRLRAAAEDSSKQEALVRVLTFFPATTPEHLLDALHGEEKRERRRLLLALLESYGTVARTLAWQRLQESMSSFGDQDVYLQRNLLLLLRRIPRPEEASLEEEVSVATALSSPAHPLTLVKEAVAYLGQTRHSDAEKALSQRAVELERLILHPDESPYKHQDLVSSLDRVIYALARFGTAEAHRMVIEHGLKQHPQLGDTASRLTYLAKEDMAAETDTVSRLVLALEAELPRRILGISVRSSPERALHLIEAMSATPAHVVRECLKGVAARFRGQPLGEAAGRVVAAFEAARASAEAPPLSLSGDLEIFGLPNLLQHLAQSEACGTLAISDTRGRQVAALTFDGGYLVAARHERLEGEAAVYQLLERPITATFQFTGRRAVPALGHPKGRDVLPLLFEGQRRYDELLAMATLVPDDATFRATEVKPSGPRTEKDTSFIGSVWLAAISGATAEECEADHAVDSFRVRRLLAHWVEEGALTLR